jgi:pimeloyl-ACP methyl ester carboxylesterase
MNKIFQISVLFLILSFPAQTVAAEEAFGKLYTRDKVSIAYEHVKNGFDSVVIICPGFFNSKSNRWMQEAARIVSSEHDVILFDFRGHGESGGKFTWSSKESIDLEAVVGYAAGLGYKEIDILAFSLGAVAAIDVASRRSDIAKMVLVSAPTHFSKINFNFWEPGMFADLKDNIDCKWEGKGARCGWMFGPKPDPMFDIKKIDKTAILFIHGDSDWVIKHKQSNKLYNAASTRKELVVVKNGYHAERLIQQYPEKMKELILGWFRREK